MMCRPGQHRVITAALAAKAAGAGYRAIAVRLGRPVSGVRAWLPRSRPEHADWLYRQGAALRARRPGAGGVSGAPAHSAPQEKSWLAS